VTLGVISGVYSLQQAVFNLYGGVSTAPNLVPAFVSANGNTTAAAYATLLAGIASGRAYFNVHTTINPNGDLSGFYQPGQLPASISTSYTTLLTPNSGGAAGSNDQVGSGSSSVTTSTLVTQLGVPGSTSLTAIVNVQNLPSAITAAHIHCCTATPYSGTAGPALVTFVRSFIHSFVRSDRPTDDRHLLTHSLTHSLTVD
jgi:hypothetical protein